MNVLKLVGWIALGGLLLGGAIGGALYVQYRQRKKNATPGPTPSKPPRDTSDAKTPSTPARAPTEPARNQARCRTLRRDEIGANLIADIDDMFADGWPPTPEAIDDLKPGDVIVFGVESEPTEDFDLPKQELVSASVLSVGKTEVRGRVIGPVAHADHHGNSAGHGLYVGSLVEVPRSHVMVVARLKPDPEMPKTGYGSKGDPARVFVPNYGKEPYKVHPSTVYDLELPYRTEELGWTPSRENVKYAQIGDEGLRHQIMFTEASIRGPYSLTLLDDDPKEGIVFVGKWDFVIAE